MTSNIVKSSDILTAQEVMGLLKIKRTTLYTLVKSGKLSVLRPTGHNLYLRKEVENLLFSNKEEQEQ